MHKSTPAELKINLLNTIYQFNPRSRLKGFLIQKTKSRKTHYSLREILMDLKTIIREEKMFDESNPSIIICSSELERALGVRALHVAEIRDIVLSQLTRASDKTCGKSLIQIERNSKSPANISRINTFLKNKYEKFAIRPNLLKVLRLVPGTDNNKIIFSYEEVTQILSKYILSRKDDILDPKNISVALVSNDPIGRAFGVRAFHRCQITDLLRKQLIPVTSSCPPDPTVVTHNSISSEWKISFIEEHTLDSEIYRPSN